MGDSLDAFEYFQEKGIFDNEVAAKFEEHVLSKGGTRNFYCCSHLTWCVYENYEDF